MQNHADLAFRDCFAGLGPKRTSWLPYLLCMQLDSCFTASPGARGVADVIRHDLSMTFVMGVVAASPKPFLHPAALRGQVKKWRGTFSVPRHFDAVEHRSTQLLKLIQAGHIGFYMASSEVRAQFVRNLNKSRCRGTHEPRPSNDDTVPNMAPRRTGSH